MAVEGDPGLRDRGLVLRRRHHRIDFAVERGLEADLRPNAGRIASGNDDLGSCARHGDAYSHGISEAWITSGTPSPPTDLMARSTSFNPNRCVVTSSSGKRFEASCANAS